MATSMHSPKPRQSTPIKSNDKIESTSDETDENDDVDVVNLEVKNLRNRSVLTAVATPLPNRHQRVGLTNNSASPRPALHKYEPESARSAHANPPGRPVPSDGTNNIVLLGVLICLCIFAFVLVYLYFGRIEIEPHAERNYWETFDHLWHGHGGSKSLKTAFVNQSERCWHTIRSAIRHTLSTVEPSFPGVISLVATNREEESTAICLGRRLATLVQGVYDDPRVITIEGRQYQHEDPDDAKLEIDTTIRSGLEGGTHHVVVLNEFHLLPPSAALLLHGLCDNDNAPFKQAIYIIISLVGADAKGSPNDVEVTWVWREEMDENWRQPLESRIGNNIVLVNHEHMLKGCQ